MLDKYVRLQLAQTHEFRSEIIIIIIDQLQTTDGRKNFNYTIG